MDELMSLAREHGLKVIEDCAHAIETQYHGRNVGTSSCSCGGFQLSRDS
jgi:dTDP-4-amino-4,6-dideoxygalactose transaminase